MTVCALCRKIMPGEFDPTEIVLCRECMKPVKEPIGIETVALAAWEEYLDGLKKKKEDDNAEP